MTTFLPVDCPSRSGTQLFVIGDSHAHAYLDLLEQLSAEQGRTVTALVVPGCSYVDFTTTSASRDPRCLRLAEEAQQTVLRNARHGDTVFLSSLRLPRLIESGGHRRTPVLGPGDAQASAYARTAVELESIARATQDTPRWFTPFLDAGLRVVFEMPKPILPAHPFQCVDWFNRGNPDCAGGLSELRSNQERYRAPVVEAIGQLVRAHPGLSSWDPLTVLCDATRCNALVEGRPLFFDGDHISSYGNLMLLPAFREALRGVEGPAVQEARTGP